MTDQKNVEELLLKNFDPFAFEPEKIFSDRFSFVQTDRKEKIHWITFDSEKTRYYIKFFSTDSAQERETRLLRKLETDEIAPRVVTESKSKVLFYAVIRAVPGVDLFDYFFERKNTINSETIKKIMKKALSCLKILHDQDIVHKDIKLENIIYDSEQEKIYLVDFEGACCTSYYLSPEQAQVFSLSGKVSKSSKASDMWGIGVCLYALLTEHFPFDQSKKNPLQLRKNWSPILIDFLLRIFCVDPIQRLTVDQALSHQLFC